MYISRVLQYTVYDMLFSLGCLLKAMMWCLFYNLAQNIIDCSSHSLHQQRDPNHENLTAYTPFRHTGNCSRWHFVNYRQKIAVVCIYIYLSTGLEQRGVSGRLIDSSVFTSASAVEIRWQWRCHSDKAVPNVSAVLPFPRAMILSWGTSTTVHDDQSALSLHSTVYSGVDQRNHQSSASLDFVLGIHQWPVYSLHKGPLTRKIFPFDDVIIGWSVWSL